MKRLFALVVIASLSLSVTAQDKIKWVSMEEAIALQKKNPKKIMVDMYTVWCGPCKLLDKKTFQNPDVVKYVNKHYYAVKFNAEGNDKVKFKEKTFTNPNYDPARAKKRNSAHQLTRYFQVRAYPTVVYLDENLDVLAGIRGYKTPQQIELYLKLFNSEDYKRMTTQEAFDEYYEAFKPEFSGE